VGFWRRVRSSIAFLLTTRTDFFAIDINLRLQGLIDSLTSVQAEPCTLCIHTYTCGRRTCPRSQYNVYWKAGVVVLFSSQTRMLCFSSFLDYNDHGTFFTTAITYCLSVLGIFWTLLFILIHAYTYYIPFFILILSQSHSHSHSESYTHTHTFMYILTTPYYAQFSRPVSSH